MNKPYPIITMLMLSVCMSAAGADASDALVSDTIYWEDGKLEWSDFTLYFTEKEATYRVYPVPDSLVIPYYAPMVPKVQPVGRRLINRNYLDYLDEQEPNPAITVNPMTRVRFVRREEGNFKYYEGMSFTYTLKSRNRYDVNRCDSWSLRYSQVQFDIVEAVRRQFTAVDILNPGDRAVSDYFRDIEKAGLRTFRMESSYGRDTSVIRQYEERYAAILDSLEPNPIYKAGPVNCGHGYSLIFGLFYEHFIDGLPGELITSPGLQMGMGYNYNNLSLQFILAGADVGHVPYAPFHYDSKLDYQWREGRKVTAARLSLNIGYRVLDRPYISVAPFAGAGYMSLSQKTNLPDPNNAEKYAYSDLYGQYYRLGLNLDWKLGRSLSAGISDSESLWNYNRVYREQKARFQLYGARTQLSGIGTGYSVGLSISFNIDTWINKRL